MYEAFLLLLGFCVGALVVSIMLHPKKVKQ